MEEKKRIFTVLAIDGGGVRGIVPARILEEIEERTGKPIAELFDLIGGTSTGAIISSSLTVPDPEDPSKPRFSAKDVLNFYHRLAPKVFPEMSFKSLRKLSSGVLYDPKPLEEALQENLGDNRMKDALTSLLIPATDIKNFRPRWIAHIKGQKDTSTEGWDSMLMRDAVRATTTAPTYFPAKYFETTPNEDMPNVRHRHALIDGSFFSGNTLRHLATQAKKIAPPDAEIIIVHVGTGNVEHSISPEEFNGLGPLGLVSKSNGSLLISLFVNMTVIDVENDMKEEYGQRFFNFDGSIDPEENPDSPSLSLDDARVDNLKKLEKFAEEIIKANNDEMDALCTVLKSREYAEQSYLASQEALQKLADKMEKTTTVKSLMRLYSKIVRFGNGLDNLKNSPDDTEIKELTKQLSTHHKGEIDRIYRSLLDKRQHQSKIINAIKEAGEDITRITKEIFVEPFKELPPQPPANDDKPPAAQADRTPKRSSGFKPPGL